MGDCDILSNPNEIENFTDLCTCVIRLPDVLVYSIWLFGLCES